MSRGLEFEEVVDFDSAGESGCDANLCSEAFDDVVAALGFSNPDDYLIRFRDGVGHRELKRRIQAL